MSNPPQVEKSFDENNRAVETHVQEVVTENGTERVTTILKEKTEMVVNKVVREKVVPVVIQKVTESYDQDGQLLNSDVEVVPEQALQLSYNGTVAPKAVAPVHAAEPKVSARAIMEERVGGESGLMDYVLWGVMACLAAGVLYFTVIRGWLS